MINFLKDKEDVDNSFYLFDQKRPDGVAKEITAMLAWNNHLTGSMANIPEDQFVNHLCDVHDTIIRNTKDSILEFLHEKKLKKEGRPGTWKVVDDWGSIKALSKAWMNTEAIKYLWDKDQEHEYTFYTSDLREGFRVYRDGDKERFLCKGSLVRLLEKRDLDEFVVVIQDLFKE